MLSFLYGWLLLKVWIWQMSKQKILIAMMENNLVFVKGVHIKTQGKKLYIQKQPSRGILKKRFSENTQPIYRITPMPKCDFNKVATEIALRHGCSSVNLLHIFRASFPKNPFGRLLLYTTRNEGFQFIWQKLRDLLKWGIT